MKVTQEIKAPVARKTAQESIRYTIIIIYEVPTCTNWEAADHIYTFYVLKESYRVRHESIPAII